MTKIDEYNKVLINRMKAKGEIAYGLENRNVPVTLNDLIEFCKEERISFNSPILISCPDGYFPLAYYHNAMATNENGSVYTLDCLAILCGEW